MKSERHTAKDVLRTGSLKTLISGQLIQLECLSCGDAVRPNPRKRDGTGRRRNRRGFYGPNSGIEQPHFSSAPPHLEWADQRDRLAWKQLSAHQ